MRPRWWAAVLLALGLGMAVGHAGATVPMVPVPGAPVAPGFSLPGADGVRHDLEEYRGRVVLVNFWAGWCAPCRQEMVSLQRLHEQLQGDGLTVVAIHAGPADARAAEVVRVNGLEFPLLVDETLSLGDWRVSRLPTSVLLDEQGRMIYRVAEPRAWHDPAMVDFLRRHLPDSAP